MAFSLNRNSKAKKTFKSPLWKVSHITSNEFVTFLLDRPLLSEVSSLDKDILNLLEKIIQKAGISSYVITSAVREVPIEAELQKEGLTSYYISHDSDWYSEIIKTARAEGKTADVVVPFGPALYQITKTATDFTVEDLIYPNFENYIYMGHGWVGDYDIFLFPQFSMNHIFCPGNAILNSIPKIEIGGWKMNFLITVLRKIAEHKYKKPEYLELPDLKEIGATYKDKKEEAISEVRSFLGSHMNSEICAFDLETSGFDQWYDKIRCITLAFDEKTGYYIEWALFKENKDLLKLLSEMIKSCKYRVTVNGKFDIKFLWRNGLDLDVEVNEDAMILSHVYASSRKKGLKAQTFFYTPHGGYDHKLDEYLAKMKKSGVKDPSYYDIPKDILFTYAAMDAVMTVQVWKEGLRRIHKFDEDFPTEVPNKFTGGHSYTAYEWYQFIMKLYPIICKMEFNGLYLDEEIQEAHRNIFRKNQNEAREELSKIFNVSPDYDFGSSVKLGQLLEKAGWSCHGRSVHGEYATSKEAFIEWTREGMKGVDELNKFRRASKCLGTYLGDVEKKVNQRTGVVTEEITGWPQYTKKHKDGSARIHTNFQVCGAETFRMISGEPNLQNVPTRSKEGSITKMCFTVPPAPMYFITDDNGKEWEVTQIEVINTKRGYVAGAAVTEEDTIVDVGDRTVLEYETWSSEGIMPIGIETMWHLELPTD